jgi:hypothetical protein
MTAYDDKDLGLAVLIYIAALLCGIAVFIVPVLIANGPTVIANPTAQHAIAHMAALRKSDGPYPVARLHRDDIVDPAKIAALNAKIAKAEHARHSAAAYQRRVRRTQDAREVALRRAQRAQMRRSYADARPVGSNPPGPFQMLFRAF